MSTKAAIRWCLGLGYVAVRDLVSFLKYAAHDSEGRANPVADGRPMEKAYAFGRSQTGRFIRDAIYRGFNADAGGRRVFDGVLTHVAGCGRMWMNHRFANVVVPAGQQYEDHDNAADRLPVLLRGVHGPPDRQVGCDLQAAPRPTP